MKWSNKGEAVIIVLYVKYGRHNVYCLRQYEGLRIQGVESVGRHFRSKSPEIYVSRLMEGLRKTSNSRLAVYQRCVLARLKWQGRKQYTSTHWFRHTKEYWTLRQFWSESTTPKSSSCVDNPDLHLA